MTTQIQNKNMVSEIKKPLIEKRHPPERHSLERHSDQALRLSSDDETDGVVAMASPNLLADTVLRQHSQAS